MPKYWPLWTKCSHPFTKALKRLTGLKVRWRRLITVSLSVFSSLKARLRPVGTRQAPWVGLVYLKSPSDVLRGLNRLLAPLDSQLLNLAVFLQGRATFRRHHRWSAVQYRHILATAFERLWSCGQNKWFFAHLPLALSRSLLCQIRP